MKNMSLKTVMMILAIACLAATGCRKKPANVTPLPKGALPPINNTDMQNGLQINDPNSANGMNNGGNSATPMGASHVGWNQNAEALKSETVYFDYDSANIKASEQSKISSVASYLKSNGSAAIRVEGNCDERGTEEYNRALGERRALAIREALIQSGIAADRVDTLSNGEDKPANAGHGEEAYHQNRRGDFIVLTQP